MFQDARDDPVSDAAAIDGDADLIVRHTATVVDLGGVEDRQVQLLALLLPAVEHVPACPGTGA